MDLKSDQLIIHRILPETDSEGPGRRTAIWVQGCPIRCPGCFNPNTWSFRGGELQGIDDVFELVRNIPSIEGVSLLGGEPFSQAAPLAKLAEMCRSIGLSVVTFSGHSFHILEQSPKKSWQDLLNATDLLLAGPYLQDRIDLSRPWVGSDNQEFVFLTERYQHLRDVLQNIPNRLEVHIGENGSVSLNGLARSEEITELETELQKLGLDCLAN